MTSAAEQSRQSAQLKLDSARSIDYRRRLGQFATPFDFASELASYGVSLVHEDNIRFLEPAVGTGAFYSALLATAGAKTVENAVGLEIDQEVARAAESIWGDTLRIMNEDFTDTTPMQLRANLLISNPPYVRHHYIDAGKKSILQKKIKQSLGINLSGLAGLYCYFILLAHEWLADGAISGWLIPSEFMDVNYGAAVKEYLLNHVKLLRIHRYDPRAVKFDDALVSSAVVWFSKETTPEDYEVEFSFGGTLDAPALSKSVRRSDLKREKKWTRFPELEVRSDDSKHAKVKDSFIIKRGIATGDNNFFILNKPQIEKYGLKYDYLTPVLPSPRYLDTTEVFADTDGNPLIESPLFLVNCDLPEHRIKELYPELYAYLATGVGTVSERYLCKSKKFWYQQEQREPAPILCTYMGRGTKDSELPFRFILNHSKALVTNSYLMLYPRESAPELCGDKSSPIKTVWHELNRLSPDALISEGRVYGGGLRKIEPKELGEVICSFAFGRTQPQLFQGAG
ncbi:MAG: Eco57I restriction-modification methylase domain-containing protein [Coriobacteriia bacterium]|nr:Eco57I restriction-modification methylase domain-containing protein [Coriobacteriia bacterium]